MKLFFHENGHKRGLDWWELDETGTVIDCSPKEYFWIWRETKVMDHQQVKPGDYIQFLSRHGEKRFVHVPVIRTGSSLDPDESYRFEKPSNQ